MATKQELVNNYVFQNRFKAYFNDSIDPILNYLDNTLDLKKLDTKNYYINMKCGNKDRVISFPNVFSYSYAVNEIMDVGISNFGKIGSDMNWMNIDFTKRKFRSNSYTWFLDKRMELLVSSYDKMYKIDIKSFYKQIYTHVFEKINEKDVDICIRSFNGKKTNGILLGNLLSTFSANEIMEYLSKEIKNILDGVEVLYFSDQFYIFYNDSDYNSTEIFEVVSKVIGREYFEFKINEEDSKVFSYEDLIQYKNFNRKIDNLLKDIKIKLNGRPIDRNESFEKILKFFNSFILEYYSIEPKFRFSFAEVVLKRTFSTPVNLYRLELAICKCCEKDEMKIINDLILLLKNHPSLIINYIELGIMDLLEKSIGFIDLKDNLLKYFEKKIPSTINSIESVYYMHICYRLVNNDIKEKYLKDFLKNYKDINNILKSIIYETINFTPLRSEILQYKYDDENWLVEYTGFTHSRFYMVITTNTPNRKFINTVNECKRHNIRIIKSFSDIKFNANNKKQFLNIKAKDCELLDNNNC